MAARSQTSSKKRQKELARQEKQREKAARRVQRKLEKHLPDGELAPADGEPSEASEAGDDAVPDSGVVTQ